MHEFLPGAPIAGKCGKYAEGTDDEWGIPGVVIAQQPSPPDAWTSVHERKTAQNELNGKIQTALRL